MTILYNLDPLSALDLYCHGETNGFSDEDFIKNEESRDLAVPPTLKSFLKNYGYHAVNQNGNVLQLFHPDNICEIHTHDVIEIPLLVIGLFYDDLLALQLDSSELQVVCGTEAKTGLHWSPMKLNLTGLFMIMFTYMLFQCNRHLVYSQPDRINAVLARHNMEKAKIVPGQGCPQHFSLNFNDKTETFLIAEFDEDGTELIRLHAVPLKTEPDDRNK